MLLSIDSVWEYQTVANDVPVDLFAVTVPAAGWTAGGTGPFGEGTFGPEYVSPNTLWAKATGFWIRTNITVDGIRDVLIKGRIEQALYVFWDGDYIGTVNPTNVSRTDVPKYNLIIPRITASAGVHEIAILLLDDTSTSGTSVCYASVEADYLPVVFSMQPEVPVKETLEWLTDLMISDNSTEERIKISASPRQKFSMRYPASPEMKNLAYNILWGEISKEILVPIWTQGVKISSIAVNSTTLNIDTTNSEFRAGGLAIIWKSFDDWQIVGTYDVQSSFLLISNLSRAFTNAWIIPVRYAFMNTGANKIFTGYSATFDIDFTILDNKELTVSEPTQYLSNDLYTSEGLLEGGNLTENIFTNLEVFDPGIGNQSFYNYWLKTRTARNFAVLCKDADAAWAYREFLHRRAGRYKSFWQPSFENDLFLLSTGSLTTTILVRKDEYIRSAEGRSHIAVDSSGTWLTRQITDVVSVDDNTMSLTLNASLDIASNTVRRISWLGLRRLDTDSVDISHFGAGVSESSVRTVEIGT